MLESYQEKKERSEKKKQDEKEKKPNKESKKEGKTKWKKKILPKSGEYGKKFMNSKIEND